MWDRRPKPPFELASPPGAECFERVEDRRVVDVIRISDRSQPVFDVDEIGWGNTNCPAGAGPDTKCGSYGFDKDRYNGDRWHVSCMSGGHFRREPDGWAGWGDSEAYAFHYRFRGDTLVIERHPNPGEFRTYSYQRIDCAAFGPAVLRLQAFSYGPVMC